MNSNAKRMAKKGRSCYLFFSARRHIRPAIKSLQIQFCWSMDCVRDSVKWSRSIYLNTVTVTDSLGGDEVACSKDSGLSPCHGDCCLCGTGSQAEPCCEGCHNLLLQARALL